MCNSLLVHPLSIQGFDHQRWSFSGKRTTVEYITRQPDRFKCAVCDSHKVTATAVKEREIKAGAIGGDNWILKVKMHRVRCHECNAYCMEHLDFLSKPSSRVTKSLERSILELRRDMSISALAKHFNLDWRTVKEIEKSSLAKKYKSVSLKGVKVIGIDEVYVGKRRFKTIVRDMTSGAVLHVGDGKGGDALEVFGNKLKHSKTNIETVAMDMARGYVSWVEKNLPDAVIVFDHFHIIKLMNEKVDKVRRRIVNNLEKEAAAGLKKKRFLLLKNEENLDQEELAEREIVNNQYHEVGCAVISKEKLRNVYKFARDEVEAEWLLFNWCEEADKSEIKELKSMAKCIRAHIVGILAYWSTNGINSAAVEGFNNKIGWLQRQAFGYRDQEYFRLKIFDLPNIKIQKEL